MNNDHDPKGRIPKSDITILLSLSIRIETTYPVLLEEARTIQRIARIAGYDADYEARRQRICRCDEEEYPYPVDEESEPIARFMHRIADDDDQCERF